MLQWVWTSMFRSSVPVNTSEHPHPSCSALMLLLVLCREQVAGLDWLWIGYRTAATDTVPGNLARQLKFCSLFCTKPQHSTSFSFGITWERNLQRSVEHAGETLNLLQLWDFNDSPPSLKWGCHLTSKKPARPASLLWTEVYSEDIGHLLSVDQDMVESTGQWPTAPKASKPVSDYYLGDPESNPTLVLMGAGLLHWGQSHDLSLT